MDAYIIGLFSILYSTCLCTPDESQSGRVLVVSYARQSLNKQYPTVSLILERITSSRLSCGVTCSENIECQAFHFTAKTRSCQLYKESPPSVSVSADREQILFYVRNTRNDPSSKVLPPEKQELQVKRFFVATANGHKLSQFHLNDGTSQITTYNYITYRCCLVDIHYNSDLQQIFLSTCGQDEITRFPLDSHKRSRVIRGKYNYLSVDGKNRLLFATRKGELHCMTTKGNNLRVVVQLGTHVIIRDVVTANQQAFLAYMNVKSFRHVYSILAITYSGSVLENVVTAIPEIIYCLDYNPSTHSLVYNMGTEVMMYKPVSKAYSSLCSVYYSVINIHVDQQIVYILGLNILILYDYKMNSKESVELPPSDHAYTHIMPVD